MTNDELAETMIRTIGKEIYEIRVRWYSRYLPLRSLTVIMTEAARDVLRDHALKTYSLNPFCETSGDLPMPTIHGVPIKVIPGDRIHVWVSPVKLEFDKPTEKGLEIMTEDATLFKDAMAEYRSEKAQE